jgi:hypothetical protein
VDESNAARKARSGGGCGPYTLYPNGRVQRGIKVVYKNISRYKAPAELKVTPDEILPGTLAGKQVSLITGAVEAGKIPPVSNIDEITATTPYVIYFARKTVTVY